MVSPHRTRPRLFALLVALCVVPPIAFFASLPWLKQQPDALVFLVTGITTALVVVSSVVLAALHDRRMDEWQRSNARFSSQWGWTVGASVFVLVFALPPVQDLIVSSAAIWGGDPNPDRRLVLTTFAFGFMAVIAAQCLCTILLSVGWVYWKSRPTREHP
ncbi:MAG: hypothetical protein WDM79_14965 [Terricaulis sp.]